MQLGMIGLGRMGANMVRRLLRQARPYGKHIAALFVLDLLGAPLALLLPLPLKIAIDGVLGPRPLPGFLGQVFCTLSPSNMCFNEHPPDSY